MKGIIVMWSGAIADIPSGWALCDGSLGTPDLRNRFVIGAGTTYNPNDTGGAQTHVHPFTGNGHSHGITYGAGLSIGDNFANSTTVNPATGTTDATDHKPPYFALAYIQKL